MSVPSGVLVAGFGAGQVLAGGERGPGPEAAQPPLVRHEAHVTLGVTRPISRACATTRLPHGSAQAAGDRCRGYMVVVYWRGLEQS